MKPSPNTNIRRDDKRRENNESIAPENLIRDARRLLDACGVTRSTSWVRRTVRGYLSGAIGSQFPFGAYLMNRVELNAVQRRAVANDPGLAYMLSYSDPTGELAVKHVSAATRGVLC